MKRTYTRRAVFISMLIMIFVGGCGLNPVKTANPLEGTSWMLTSYAGKTLIPGTEMTAAFKAGELSGSASCNRYFASFQTKGDALTIEGIGWTEMACLNPEGIMAQESEIMRLLGTAASYQIQGDQLIIQGTQGEQLIFAPQQAE